MANLSKEQGEFFEKRVNEDGSTNTKYVDVLDEDKGIAGQKFVCISFISPEKILKDKNMFFFEEFLKTWDMNKSMEKFTQFINFISYKYSLSQDDLMKDLSDFTKSEKDNLFVLKLEDDYKTFIDTNEERMEQEFTEMHSYQTTVRGVKVRGSYASQEEAELRCKMLREVDPNHDVYVGPVGMWMPFHPEAYKTGRVEYLEDELNQLMHEKNKNEDNAKIEFDKRLRETKEKAIEDNIKLAEDSGNKLTQTIDEVGNLVSVANASTVEAGLDKDMAVADLRKELFEGDNIRVKDDDKKDSK